MNFDGRIAPMPEGPIIAHVAIESFADLVDLKEGLWVHFLELKSRAHKASPVSRTAIVREMAGTVRWYRFIKNAFVSFVHDGTPAGEFFSTHRELSGRSR